MDIGSRKNCIFAKKVNKMEEIQKYAILVAGIVLVIFLITFKLAQKGDKADKKQEDSGCLKIIFFACIIIFFLAMTIATMHKCSNEEIEFRHTQIEHQRGIINTI